MNNWQFTPFALCYLLGGIISFYLAYKCWELRKSRGALPFSLHFIGTGFWSLGYLFGFFNSDLSWKLIMLRFEYLGVIMGLVFFVISISIYTKHDRWMNRYALTAFLIIPVLTLLQMLFVDQHTFFYKAFSLAEDEGLIVLKKDYNISFYLWMGFSYLCLLWGILVLIRSFIYQPKIFKNQLLPISIALAAFLFISVLYITNSNPIHPYDPTPLSILLIGIMMVILVIRFKFLDLIPAAHSIVFKNLTSGVIVIDQHLRIVAFNPAAAKELVGEEQLPTGEPLAQYLPDLNAILEQTKESPASKTEIVYGSNRTFEIEVTPLVSKGGAPRGNILMMHDITTLRQTVNDLNAYAYMVAHDLKNPLSQQIGAIELLASQEHGIKPKEELFGMLREGNQKMREIIDSLLLLADVRNRNVDFECLELAQISSSALHRLSKVINDSKSKIEVQASWPSCQGYAQWVEEIWVNYIHNAIKYGGKPPLIELGAKEVGEEVHCWVKDNGEGIIPEDQANVFQEFKRLKKHTKSESGHGLGLSIVMRIAHRMNGNAWVESDGRNGSTFYFSLPK